MPVAVPCRLLVDPPADGAWNMAVDEALAELVATDSLPTLRLYQWQRPTLSLGYFQKYDDRQQHRASGGAEVVRRQSGGGAIVHDHELTYSIALPASHPLARDPQRLYDAVHEEMWQLLRRRVAAVDAPWEAKRCQPVAGEEQRSVPFLCFQRRSRGDVMLRSLRIPHVEHKVVGSAQRRRRGVVLQHGSMLLRQSTAAPELPGLVELTGQTWPVDRLATELSDAVLGNLRLHVRETELPLSAQAFAEHLLQQKYRNFAWTRRR